MSSDTTQFVIFDCDGVLIDSEILSAATLTDLLRPLGVSINVAYVQYHFLGKSFPTVAELIRRRFETDLPADFEMAYRRKLLERFETDLQTTKGVENILAQLEVRSCVATSSSPQRAGRSLEITGLAGHFAGRVYTASEVKRGKPAPDLFLHVARQESFKPEDCLVIEDSIPGLRAARAAGMTVWWYTGGSHLAGGEMALPEDIADLPAFDSWAQFYEMAPSFKAGPGQSTR